LSLGATNPDGVATVLDAVREGYGYTVLPLASVRPYNPDDGFSIRVIVRPQLLIQLSLIVSAQRPTTPLTQLVLQLLPQTALPILGGIVRERS